jgi:molybdopterin-guanine dinucleotide biosynthesis protein A
MSDTPPLSTTALILAGGRGARMGGVDKGLQPFNGIPLVQHTLHRLQAQHGAAPTQVVVNANRNASIYEDLQIPVWPDAVPGAFEGPLAGFLTGLQRSNSPYLLTVPCDTPLFPLDLLPRLLHALQAGQADIAVASAPEVDNTGALRVRPQPVFCLMRADTAAHLAASLETFMHSGGRKIDAWTAQHRTVHVAFNLPGDDPRAFSNANTLAELQLLETQATKIP